MENQPNSPSPKAPVSPKRSISPAHWAMIILATIAVIVGVLYYIKQPAPDLGPITIPHKDELKDWNAYTNTEYGFELKYPSYVQVGEKSISSVLGDANKDVPGIYLGKLILVPLNNASAQVMGETYFQNYYNAAKNPSTNDESGPSFSCDFIPVNNSAAIIDLVGCGGEGGSAIYGMIRGLNLKIFIDGYSRGWADKDTSYLGDFEEGDLQKVLSTFKFTNTSQSSELLLKFTTTGGLCVDGPCDVVTTIASDGAITVKHIREEKTNKLSTKDLSELKNLIVAADFEAIKKVPFTGLCPTAYDGQQQIYEFYVEGGTEKIDSCEVAVDENDPLFKKVADILNTYVYIATPTPAPLVEARIDVKVGQTVKISNSSLSLKLISVNDSRCPSEPGVACVWAGTVTANIELLDNGKTLGTADIEINRLASVGGYGVTFSYVKPEEKKTNTQTSEYTLTFTISN